MMWVTLTIQFADRAQDALPASRLVRRSETVRRVRTEGSNLRAEIVTNNEPLLEIYISYFCNNGCHGWTVST
jgi:hypothetical protein